MTIHWCGTGLSAIPGLRRLLEAGHDITVWNRTVDKAQEAVGDLLHEAGHIAMSPPSKRDVMGGTLDEELGVQLEMAAIAWSYAACSFLKLDPKRGFPRDGIQRR